MNILVITNLYPPQELGGYGRSIADFAWGLKELGHEITVMCSDAPYLNTKQRQPKYQVNRNLLLKGSYENGVSTINNPMERSRIDNHNINLIEKILLQEVWDGILIGNIDFLGHEILPILVKNSLPVLHHIGFMQAPFNPFDIPNVNNYKLLSASKAVFKSLKEAGFNVDQSNVIYPGARVELFGEKYTKRKLPELPDGSANNPLCIGFAGLLMASKGLHTLIEAIIKLKQKNIFTRTYIAGASFQSGYKEALEKFLSDNKLRDSVFFTGSLNRLQLARFFRLNHVFIFPSIFPEAFGIVQAEAMASGLALLSSGVGGSKELIEPGVNGWIFKKEDSEDLSQKLSLLATNPNLITQFGKNGNIIARRDFSTIASAKKIEKIFLKYIP